MRVTFQADGRGQQGRGFVLSYGQLKLDELNGSSTESFIATSQPITTSVTDALTETSLSEALASVTTELGNTESSEKWYSTSYETERFTVNNPTLGSSYLEHLDDRTSTGYITTEEEGTTMAPSVGGVTTTTTAATVASALPTTTITVTEGIGAAVTTAKATTTMPLYESTTTTPAIATTTATKGEQTLSSTTGTVTEASTASSSTITTKVGNTTAAPSTSMVTATEQETETTTDLSPGRDSEQTDKIMTSTEAIHWTTIGTTSSTRKSSVTSLSNGPTQKISTMDNPITTWDDTAEVTTRIGPGTYISYFTYIWMRM